MSGAARGPEGAPVTIVEFSDYQCPFCLRAEHIVDQVLAKYPQEVRFVYRHYPLAQHPMAREAAKSAVCAEAQGHFWEYHRLVFENQPTLSPELLSQFVTDLALDPEAFDQCMKAPETERRIATDVAEAEGLGADSTPVFLINGLYFTGAQAVEHFDRLIQRELEALGRG